jgi:hypothetical protein
MTPFSPVKVNQGFGRRHRLHLQGLTVSPTRNQPEAGSKQNFCLLHSLLFQKMELFKPTAVRTLNPFNRS